MFCRFCGVTLPAGSQFCNACGKPLGGGVRAARADAGTPPPLPPPIPGPPPLPAGPASGAAPHVKVAATRLAPAPEREIWQGTVSARSMIGSFAVSLLWTAGVLAAAAVYPTFRARPVLFVVAAAAVLPFCYVYFVWGWETLRVRYRLTTARLLRREGVVFRRTTELELARVGDVSVEQTLLDRVFDTGTVVALSKDAGDPAVRVEGIDRPHDLKEKIRTAALLKHKGAAFVETP